jgi:hypothetical protein
MTAPLMNLTNPMMKGSIREAIPTPGQKVHIRTPGDRRAMKVHLL